MCLQLPDSCFLRNTSPKLVLRRKRVEEPAESCSQQFSEHLFCGPSSQIFSFNTLLSEVSVTHQPSGVQYNMRDMCEQLFGIWWGCLTTACNVP